MCFEFLHIPIFVVEYIINMFPVINYKLLYPCQSVLVLQHCRITFLDYIAADRFIPYFKPSASGLVGQVIVAIQVQTARGTPWSSIYRQCCIPHESACLGQLQQPDQVLLFIASAMSIQILLKLPVGSDQVPNLLSASCSANLPCLGSMPVSPPGCYCCVQHESALL